MTTINSGSHLTLDERRIILQKITIGASKTEMANAVGKDKSTIAKEIKKHRILRYKCKLPRECSNYKKCPYGRQCTADCPEFVQFVCKRRDRTPGACNGCSYYAKCRFDKYYYDPEIAQHEYEDKLVGSRQGVNLDPAEAERLANVVKPLLEQGQSPYKIVTEHKELGICEKTLYNYIDFGVLKDSCGITVMHLRRQTSRKISKKKANEYKKRSDKKYLEGRKYSDFLKYKEENPDVYITEMDTVYNDETNGPFIQTFKFLCCGLLFCILHEEKTAQSMKEGIDLLEKILGQEIFCKYVNILLTDRGSEFAYANAIETAENGLRRCRVYYCDPMRSNQKGSLENKHIELRYILPKGTDLRGLGLVDQNAMNIVTSHLDSSPLKSLEGKSPLDLAKFLYPDLYEKLTAYGIENIEKDKVILKPYLLKK